MMFKLYGLLHYKEIHQLLDNPGISKLFLNVAHVDVDIFSRTKYLQFGISLHPYPYFLHISSGISGESLHLHRLVLVFVVWQLKKKQSFICCPMALVK